MEGKAISSNQLEKNIRKIFHFLTCDSKAMERDHSVVSQLQQFLDDFSLEEANIFILENFPSDLSHDPHLLKPFLVMNIDECLVYFKEINSQPRVFFRPHLEELIRKVEPHFRLIFTSRFGQNYLELVSRSMFEQMGLEKEFYTLKDEALQRLLTGREPNHSIFIRK